MGWGTGNLGGGSAVGLNFDVLGGSSQPIKPKENTIWVNTPIEITGYYFQANQPSSMKHGEVWISTGTGSVVSFNAIKKGTIMVYPLNAKQMRNGELEDITAQSYQNGEWVNWWNGELYEPGNVYEKYTGGWQKGEYTSGAVDLTDTGIVLETPGQVPRAHVETIKKVEFGDYKKIKAIVEIISCPTDTHVVRLGYSTAPGTSLASITTKNELKPGRNFTGEKTIDLDISSAPSNAYVVVGAGYAGMKFIVKKVQMIK